MKLKKYQTIKLLLSKEMNLKTYLRTFQKQMVFGAPIGMLTSPNPLQRRGLSITYACL